MPPEILNILVQIPIVAVILIVVERRDRQWQQTLKEMNAQMIAAMNAMTISNNTLSEKIACMATAETVAKELRNEFWGRRDGGGGNS